MRLTLPDLDRRQLLRLALPAAVLPAALPIRPALASGPSEWPLVGLGTCCEEATDVADHVAAGVSAGYRLIDTAAHYPGESGVGDAIAALEARGVVRPGEVMTVTKVWFDDMGYEPALASARRSLQRLRRDRLDVLLIHFPGSPDAVQEPKRNRQLRAETWRALETLQADGYVRTIGVSNWSRRHLRETLGSASTRVTPQVLQTEVHPLLQQRDLRDDCAAAGVRVMGHCPLAHGAASLLSHPTLARIGAARGRSPAQVALRWAVQRDVLPVPHASSAARLRENLEGALGFELSADELALVDAMDAGERVSFDPKLIA